MKLVYPVIIGKVKTEQYIDVYIPDLEINTEGENIADAIAMARDAIGAKILCCEDLKQDIPMPSAFESVHCADNEFVTMVDVDIDEYRRKNDMRTVRRNVTLPYWLDMEAKKSKINVSAVLQRALKNELNIQA